MPQLRRHVALALAVVMFALTGPIDAARAALVTTGQAIEAGAAHRASATGSRPSSRARTCARRWWRSASIRSRPSNRVAGLSDAEVRQIAGHLDQLPAGQSALGIVIGAALFIFIVLLITDLLGLTNVFPFVRR